jgi:hypothetical protein
VVVDDSKQRSRSHAFLVASWSLPRFLRLFVASSSPLDLAGSNHASKSAGRRPTGLRRSSSSAWRRRLPCAAQTCGPPRNSLRSLRSLRTDAAKLDVRGTLRARPQVLRCGGSDSPLRPPAHRLASTIAAGDAAGDASFASRCFYLPLNGPAGSARTGAGGWRSPLAAPSSAWLVARALQRATYN